MFQFWHIGTIGLLLIYTIHFAIWMWVHDKPMWYQIKTPGNFNVWKMTSKNAVHLHWYNLEFIFNPLRQLKETLELKITFTFKANGKLIKCVQLPHKHIFQVLIRGNYQSQHIYAELLLMVICWTVNVNTATRRSETSIRGWLRNYIHVKRWDVIIDPCRNVN